MARYPLQSVGWDVGFHLSEKCPEDRVKEYTGASVCVAKVAVLCVNNYVLLEPKREQPTEN